MVSTTFMPSWVYTSAAVAARELSHYANRFWHPLAAAADLTAGSALTVELLGIPVLLTRPSGEGEVAPRAFVNRCPHRGVALQATGGTGAACRRLICPYHGWTYDLQGQLLAAARESDFLERFDRADWPLQVLACRELGPLIWVALTADPLPLEHQLDLVLQEAADLFAIPRPLLARQQRPLACNWKLAHDNTLDDYHVAIAHPTTLHREQGPVRDYRHAFSAHGTLLATPHGQGTFYTFGLAPWTHLLLWPDQRLALISFLPRGSTAAPASALDQCSMDVWLFGPAALAAKAAGWMDDMQSFLEEDRRLVESAQRGYGSQLTPGPVHRLEQRIVQWQALYHRLMDLDSMHPG